MQLDSSKFPCPVGTFCNDVWRYHEQLQPQQFFHLGILTLRSSFPVNRNPVRREFRTVIVYFIHRARCTTIIRVNNQYLTNLGNWVWLNITIVIFASPNVSTLGFHAVSDLKYYMYEIIVWMTLFRILRSVSSEVNVSLTISSIRRCCSRKENKCFQIPVKTDSKEQKEMNISISCTYVAKFKEDLTTYLVPQSNSFELLLILVIINVLENILEASIIPLQDRILRGQI